jgi:hypothetical protein
MNLYQIIILLVLSAIAIRFTFKFDLNKFLESRRKIKLEQLKNICSHCKIEFVDKGKVKITPYFVSLFGSFQWKCSRCGCIVECIEDVDRICGNYGKNPKKFLKNEKRFFKQMKKLGLA